MIKLDYSETSRLIFAPFDPGFRPFPTIGDCPVCDEWGSGCEECGETGKRVNPTAKLKRRYWLRKPAHRVAA